MLGRSLQGGPAVHPGSWGVGIGPVAEKLTGDCYVSSDSGKLEGSPAACFSCWSIDVRKLIEEEVDNIETANLCGSLQWRTFDEPTGREIDVASVID